MGILLCIMRTHIFVHIIDGILTPIIIPTVCNHYAMPMYNVHPYLSQKNLGKKCIIHGKIGVYIPFVPLEITCGFP